MRSSTNGADRALGAALGLTAAGAAALAYASLVERNAFVVRERSAAILPEGTPEFRILHISDLHMLRRQNLKQTWVRQLVRLRPDLVVNTGDNLSAPDAVPAVVQALDELLEIPGLFVFGSNDYFAPKPKNPLSYLTGRRHEVSEIPLPWADLRAAFIERGWRDATHSVHEFEVAGVRIAAAGVDDPHIERDRYDTIRGLPNPLADLRLGLTHSPEPRVLDAFADDGYDLVLAGHTHGGQVCLPGGGAIVTNCGIDRSRARGLSRWGSRMMLHVSAGMGTSPFAPVRVFCRPEVTLLTLTPVRQTPRNTRPEQHVSRFGESVR